MKRIGLFLGLPPEGGGAFQYAQSILEALLAFSPADMQLVVIYTHPAWQPRLARHDARIEFNLLREGGLDKAIKLVLRMGLPLAPWRAFAKRLHPFTRHFLAKSCDLWVFPGQDIWTYALPVPALGVIHDLMHRYERRFPEVSAFGLFKRRERHYKHLCATARGLLVDSTIGKQQVISSYTLPAERIHVLPYVAPSYIYSKFEPPDFDQRYHLPEKFLFYPAQFWEHKNHHRLLQAMAQIRPLLPDLHLVLAGARKNAYSDVMRSIDGLQLGDRVQVTGYVPDEDMPVFYRRARAMVMPTFFGPTNIPPLEAMVTGCPMAVSDIYAMSTQVGDAALLFDPSSVDDIAQAIRRLATDDALCQQLAAAGRARATAWGQLQFNERFGSILNSVLAG